MFVQMHMFDKSIVNTCYFRVSSVLVFIIAWNLSNLMSPHINLSAAMTNSSLPWNWAGCHVVPTQMTMKRRKWIMISHRRETLQATRRLTFARRGIPPDKFLSGVLERTLYVARSICTDSPCQSQFLVSAWIITKAIDSKDTSD